MEINFQMTKKSVQVVLFGVMKLVALGSAWYFVFAMMAIAFGTRLGFFAYYYEPIAWVQLVELTLMAYSLMIMGIMIVRIFKNEIWHPLFWQSLKTDKIR